MPTSATVLFVCTGNLCRSVMAQAMLEARATASNIELTIASAGLAIEGVPPPRLAVGLMRQRGLDVAEYRSRRLREPLIDQADLVLGAARMHAWEAVALKPEAVRRVFTLKEFVRLANDLEVPRDQIQFDEWVRRVHVSRRRSDVLDNDDDIDDPYGKSRRRFTHVMIEIDSLIEQLWGLMESVLRTSTPAGGTLHSEQDPMSKQHFAIG